MAAAPGEQALGGIGAWRGASVDSFRSWLAHDAFRRGLAHPASCAKIVAASSHTFSRRMRPSKFSDVPEPELRGRFLPSSYVVWKSAKSASGGAPHVHETPVGQPATSCSLYSVRVARTPATRISCSPRLVPARLSSAWLVHQRRALSDFLRLLSGLPSIGRDLVDPAALA